MTKKKEHKNEILENPEALAEKIGAAEHWIERNPKMIIGIATVILLVVAGYFGFNYYKGNKNQQAQREMFQAVFYFEADSLSKALEGDGNNLGFLDIIDEYGITEAANLAHFYTGAIYLKQGEYELARTHLKDFSADDILVQARAYALIGDTYMEEQKYDDAAEFYSKAANYKPNKYFTPTYLMKAALAYERANQNGKASDAYQRIIDEYWDSPEVQNAQKFKTRLGTNS